MVKVKFLQINKSGKPGKYSIILQLSDFIYKNTLQFAQKRERTLDGTMLNNVDSYYIVESQFVIAKMTLEEYSRFVQIVNAPSFIMQCYDYEICKSVQRKMALSKYSRNRLLAMQGNISDIIGVQLDAEGIESYKDYDELMTVGIITDIEQTSEVIGNTSKAVRWV